MSGCQSCCCPFTHSDGDSIFIVIVILIIIVISSAIILMNTTTTHTLVTPSVSQFPVVYVRYTVVPLKIVYVGFTGQPQTREETSAVEAGGQFGVRDQECCAAGWQGAASSVHRVDAIDGRCWCLWGVHMIPAL